MKKLFTILLLNLLVGSLAYGQLVPRGMKYQAVARDLTGTIMANQEIALKINLTSPQTKGGQVHYSETHTVTTNQFGLFTLTVGEGGVSNGSFNAIPWSSEDIWMEVSIRDKGRSSFATLSSSKLLAVPYAIHAATASELVGNKSNPQARVAAADPGVPSQNWSLFGNSKSDETKDKLGTTDNMGLVLVTNNVERMKISRTGDINMANSLNVGKDVNVGQDLTVQRNVYLNKGTGGQTINYGPFTVERLSPTVLTGTLRVDGISTSTNTTESTAKTNGALVVAGGVGIGKKLNVGGNGDVDGTLNVDGATTLQNTLTVSGATVVNNTVGLNGQVTISADVNGPDGSYGSYPLRVEGSNQGVAIKVDGSRNNSNNFVTFMDANGIQGRIEGQTEDELLDSFDYKHQSAFYAIEGVATVADIAGLAAEAVALGAAVITAPAVAGVAAQGVAVTIRAAALIAEAVTWTNHKKDEVGVAYESGSGDYAEWLERAKDEKDMTYGQIVGVKGGKISLSTDEVDHFMVVSKSPIVLGNMPQPKREKDFEKVAFMGQVPVRVVGKVAVGDYIIPSGNNDGMGIAVHPADMKLGDYARIVGVSWQAAKDASHNIVNVAVGINTNDLTSKMVALNEKVDGIMAYLQGKGPLPGGDMAAGVATAKVEKGNTATQAQTKTTLSKTISDADFDLAIDKMTPQLVQYFDEVKKQLNARGIDTNANPYLAEVFKDPAAAAKQLRRDPSLSTQWGRVDQQLQNKTKK